MAYSKRRSLRERVSTRKALVGLLQTYPSPLFAELASSCGYDFLFLDGEHGVLSEADFAQSLTALTQTEALGLVRLAGHDAHALQRYMSMGADGIIVPHVSSAEEVRSLLCSTDPQVHASLIVIIESKLGVQNADEILKIDGVDAAIIGPHDLSADLGCYGDYSHPSYADAFSSIEASAASAGKAVGTIPHGSFTLEALYMRGHQLLILGGDRSLVRDAMSAQTAKARSIGMARGAT